MARNVATLSVMLTASTGQFTSRMGAAARPVTRFANSVSSSASRLARFGLTLAGIGSVGGAAFLFARTLSRANKEIDSISRQSSKLGVLSNNLITLQLAGKSAGIESETLNKNLLHMTSTIANATQGMNSGSFALHNLGLSASEMFKLSPDRQFFELAGAIERVRSQADRLRLTIALFGAKGSDIVNVLSLGKRGLLDFERAARASGFAVSSLDAKKVEIANAAFQKLGILLDGIARQLVVQLSPLMIAMYDDLFRMGTTGDDMGTKIANAVQWVSEAFAKASDFVTGFSGGLKMTMAGGRIIIRAFAQVFVKALEGIVIAGNFAFKKLLQGAGLLVKGLAPALNTILSTMNKIARTDFELIDTNRITEDIDLFITRMTKGGEALQAGLAGYFDELKAGNIEDTKLFDEGVTELLKAGSVQVKVREYFDRIRKGADAAAAAALNTAGSIDAVAESARRAGDVGQFKGVQLALTALQDKTTDLSRINPIASVGETGSEHLFGGGRSVVRDPQLQETNKILNAIAINTRMVPVVG